MFRVVLILIITSVCVAVAAEKYVLPATRMIVEMSLDIAMKEAGTSDANNPGRIKEYLKAAGVGYYNPFCMSGQYWSFVQAREIIRYVNKQFGFKFTDVIPFPRTALANYPFHYAKKHGAKAAYKPEKYDFIIWYVAKTVNGHIERIVSVDKAGWVTTIAFNTDNRQVKFKKRHITNPIGNRLIRGLVGWKYD